MATTETFFYIREEDDLQVRYRLKRAWLAFVVAWIAIAGMAAWAFADEPLATYGSVVGIAGGIGIGIRWFAFLSANREMLAAKYSGRMAVSGSKFSTANPPVVTITKVTSDRSPSGP